MGGENGGRLTFCTGSGQAGVEGVGLGRGFRGLGSGLRRAISSSAILEVQHRRLR